MPAPGGGRHESDALLFRVWMRPGPGPLLALPAVLPPSQQHLICQTAPAPPEACQGEAARQPPELERAVRCNARARGLPLHSSPVGSFGAGGGRVQFTSERLSAMSLRSESGEAWPWDAETATARVRLQRALRPGSGRRVSPWRGGRTRGRCSLFSPRSFLPRRCTAQPQRWPHHLGLSHFQGVVIPIQAPALTLQRPCSPSLAVKHSLAIPCFWARREQRAAITERLHDATYVTPKVTASERFDRQDGTTG